MSETATEPLRQTLDALYRTESGRICATLIRLLGDFELAENAVHDTFADALERFPQGSPSGLNFPKYPYHD